MRSATEWAQVRALAADGVSKRQIAARLGINRRTVDRLIEAPKPPRYERAPRGSMLDPLQPVLLRLLEEWPEIKAPRVTEILREDYGYARSVDLVKKRLARMRPSRVRPAQKTGYRPGRVLQLDWAEMPTPRVRERLQATADRAREEGWAYEQFLEVLLEAEVFARDASGARQRIRHAAFPAHQTLEDFDFTAQPTAEKPLLLHLAQLGWISEHANVCLIGPPGTGKTHLAIALAIKACQAGHRVACRRSRLPAARAPGRQPALRAGLAPLRTRLDHRHLKPRLRGLGEILGDAMVAAALIDRLVHHATMVTLKGKSYRRRERDTDTAPRAKPSRHAASTEL